jgi:flavin-dependent dehydrogenase
MNANTYKVDVLIVGGGPAGASAALSLLTYSEQTVLLIEQSNLEQTRVGEHVSASLFDLTSYLKIEKKDFEAGSFLPAYENVSFWGSDLPTSVNSIYMTEGSTFQLDREKFDFKLIEEVVDRGGTILPRTKCTNFVQLEDNTWEITVKHPEKIAFSIHAKYLVDATGRNATICRQVGASAEKMDALMGVGFFFELAEDANLRQEQLLETTEFGWWYVAQLPNNKVVATFFTDADIVSEKQLNQQENWNALLQQTKQVKHKLKGASSLSTKPWVRNAATQISDSSTIDNFIAIGDAAAAFDPISSMGIGFAMTSACHAAKLIQEQLSTETKAESLIYQENLFKNFENYLTIRQQFYQKEKRWLSSPFWQRRNGTSS